MPRVSWAAGWHGVQRRMADAALEAGVVRIVYSSFLSAAPHAVFTFARDNYATEEHIRASGIPFTIVRGAPFHEVVPWLVGPDGVIRGPADEGRFASVGRDDLAGTLAAILANPEPHEGRSYDVTGPAALSMDDVAAELSAASGRSISYVRETPEEAWESRRASGVPDWQLAGWVGTYLQIARGDLDRVTDTVTAVTGHPAVPFAEHLRRHPEDDERLL